MNNIDESLTELMSINGAVGACIVDYTSGMALGTAGSGVDLELAAAGNSEVLKAKLQTMESLGIKGGIEDILITLSEHFHIIRPCEKHEGLFIYIVLDKKKANLALARRNVLTAEETLAV